MGNLISRNSFVAAVIGLLLLSQTAGAQEAPPDLFGGGDAGGSNLVGVIGGTDMLRDEFRARALIQLKAIALNALAYRLANEDQYPQTFHKLKSSDSWNLDITNMFTGEPIREIIFQPDKDDMTTRMVLDLPLDLDESVSNMGTMLPMTGGGQSAGDGGEGRDDSGGDTIPTIQPIVPATMPRIDARKVNTFSGGDVLYFVSGDMLQLVLYAPDGTYVEFVDVKPNGHWRRRLDTAGCPYWPASIGAAEVLFFTELVPQHHNLVDFMGNRETIPPVKFPMLIAAQRLEMALDLNITVLNPITHNAAVSQADFSLGDFAASDTALGAPLSLFMDDGRAWTAEMLTASAGEPSVAAPPEEQPKPKPKPGHPPLGGRT
jgi:hypothetical protein